MSTDTVGSNESAVTGLRWTNIRRKVFYQYPNGSAPLIGLLSMMKEESTNDPEFSWLEKRLKEQRTQTAAISSAIAYYKTVDTTAYSTDGSWTAANGDITWTAATLSTPTGTGAYGILVDDNSLFRVGHIIKFKSYLSDDSATVDVIGRVTGLYSTTRIAFVVLKTTAACDYDYAGNIDQEVQVIGSAFQQGVTDLTSEVYYLPTKFGNYTQIFRTPFSFTGNALVTPVKFDDTGIYKDKAKSHSIDHMIEMELATMFGTKWRSTEITSNTTAPVPTTGAGLPIYTTGGILYFLQWWEQQYSSYRGGNDSNSGPAAVTADSDDNKRIITNSTGSMNEATYDTYLERVFRTSSNVSNEKLVLCGSGFLKVMNQMYRSQSTFVYYPPSGDTFGMELVAHKTAFGTIYYKTHPLFSRNSTLRNNALFLDVHNLRYRPMDKRDTQLLKNRQPNDADYRKDEWFTEFGLELRMPESFMYLQNVTSYIP